MHKINVTMGKDVFEENNRIAAMNAALLKQHQITSVDLMGSIGSGKTLLIEAIVEKLLGEKRVGVIVGDVIHECNKRE